MPQPFTTAVPDTAAHAGGYGIADHYDFDNPSKWHTVTDVPLLDEHELTDSNGEPEGYVDRTILEEIAKNNNRRVYQTGDPATLILGHTSDDPRAPEKPAKGFIVNYKVKARRDPVTGQAKYALHGDYKLRHRNAHLLEEYPRRSVELWLNKREIDPVALLGGSTPERDLGVIIRKARQADATFDFGTVIARTKLAAVVIDHAPRTEREKRLARLTDTIHYAARDGYVLRYAMEDTTMPCGPGGMPNRYAENEPDPDDADTGADDGDMGDNPDLGGSDLGGDEFGDDGDMGGADDPMVAKVLASKPFRDLQAQVQQIMDAVLGGGEGAAGPGGAGGAPGGVASPPPPGAGAPPPGGGMGGPPPPDDEAARFHGAGPVRFDDMGGDEDGMGMPGRYSASGFAGPISGYVPTTTTGSRYSRNGHTGAKPPMNATRQARRPAPQPAPAKQDPEVIRLKRSLADMQKKLARKDAEQIIQTLENEGILFGDTADEHKKERDYTVNYFTLLDDQTRAGEVARIRRCYKRRDVEAPMYAGGGDVARYSRSAVPTGPETDESDFNPKDPQEAMEFARVQLRFKGEGSQDWKEKAIKFMRSRKPAARR